MRILVVAVVCCVADAAYAAELLKIAVMPAKYAKSAARIVEHEVFDEAMLAAVQAAGQFSVIGKSDMDSVLGFDKQKQALGCSDTVCFAEIGGALGVDRIVDVQVAKADASWMINAKLIDIRSATPVVVSRVFDASTRGGTDALMAALPSIAQRLLVGQVGAHVQNAPIVSSTPVIAVSTATTTREQQADCADKEPKKCTALGRAYFYGTGVTKDLFRAASLYERACDHGDARGCLHLGTMYGEGNGLVQNASREVDLYRRSCEGRDGLGCIALGVEYEYGGGPVARDSRRAAELYQKACDLGEKRGCDERARIAR